MLLTSIVHCENSVVILIIIQIVSKLYSLFVMYTEWCYLYVLIFCMWGANDISVIKAIDVFDRHITDGLVSQKACGVKFIRFI